MSGHWWVLLCSQFALVQTAKLDRYYGHCQNKSPFRVWTWSQDAMKDIFLTASNVSARHLGDFSKNSTHQHQVVFSVVISGVVV